MILQMIIQGLESSKQDLFESIHLQLCIMVSGGSLNPIPNNNNNYRQGTTACVKAAYLCS